MPRTEPVGYCEINSVARFDAAAAIALRCAQYYSAVFSRPSVFYPRHLQIQISAEHLKKKT